MSLLDMYPNFWAAIPAFSDIQNALDPEAKALKDAVEDYKAQLCISTATWGLNYWEQALGLPIEADKPLEFRRSRAAAKIRGSGVTTPEMIRDVAAAFSEGSVDVIQRPALYQVAVRFTGTIGIPPNMDDLTATLKEIMPAHLEWVYEYIYNTYKVLEKFTNKQLAAMTHFDIRNDEVLTNG